MRRCGDSSVSKMWARRSVCCEGLGTCPRCPVHLDGSRPVSVPCATVPRCFPDAGNCVPRCFLDAVIRLHSVTWKHEGSILGKRTSHSSKSSVSMAHSSKSMRCKCNHRHLLSSLLLALGSTADVTRAEGGVQKKHSFAGMVFASMGLREVNAALKQLLSVHFPMTRPHRPKKRTVANPQDPERRWEGSARHLVVPEAARWSAVRLLEAASAKSWGLGETNSSAASGSGGRAGSSKKRRSSCGVKGGGGPGGCSAKGQEFLQCLSEEAVIGRGSGGAASGLLSPMDASMTCLSATCRQRAGGERKGLCSRSPMRVTSQPESKHMRCVRRTGCGVVRCSSRRSTRCSGRASGGLGGAWRRQHQPCHRSKLDLQR
jgi:hypothetical protein